MRWDGEGVCRMVLEKTKHCTRCGSGERTARRRIDGDFSGSVPFFQK
jgi:hypothetical protein